MSACVSRSWCGRKGACAAPRGIAQLSRRRTFCRTFCRTYFERALAIREEARDRPRARSLAELARTAYAEAGDKSAKELEEVDAWQAEHAGSP